MPFAGDRIDKALGDLVTAQAAVPTTPSLGTVVACEGDPRTGGEEECPSYSSLSAELDAVALALGDAADADDQHEAVQAVASAASGLITVTDQLVELILLVN